LEFPSFLDENFNISENNNIFAKDSSDSRRPKIPFKKAPQKKYKKKEQRELKWDHIGTYGELLPNPAFFFWLNLSIWLKEISIWLNPYIYIFFMVV
jgi:hypothetical protein